VNRGPYFKHQCWENGKNRSTYIPPVQIGALREDLENGKRFQQITDELAAAAIQQSRARRAATAPSSETLEKKTSKRTVSTKNTAKPKLTLPKSGNVSSNKKSTKP
jgi:topoisomerase IA-like protein